MINSLKYTLLFLFASLVMSAQIKTKPFNELKGVDSMKIQVNFNSINSWSFIVSDIEGDSLMLSQKLKDIKNGDYLVSNIQKFDDDSSQYAHKFFAILSQKKKYSFEDLKTI